MKAADLRKRLDAISTAMAGTFAARFRTLTEAEKEAYHAWNQRCCRHYERYQGGEAYELALSGEPLPALPRTIREKLFVSTPVITADMTMDQAAEIYRRFARGD